MHAYYGTSWAAQAPWATRAKGGSCGRMNRTTTHNHKFKHSIDIHFFCENSPRQNCTLKKEKWKESKGEKCCRDRIVFFISDLAIQRESQIWFLRSFDNYDSRQVANPISLEPYWASNKLNCVNFRRVYRFTIIPFTFFTIQSLAFIRVLMGRKDTQSWTAFYRDTGNEWHYWI